MTYPYWPVKARVFQRLFMESTESGAQRLLLPLYKGGQVDFITPRHRSRPASGHYHSASGWKPNYNSHSQDASEGEIINVYIYYFY